MLIAQEEIFGPVLSVLGFEDEEEAIAIANGTRYGLNASVWTSDVSRAIRLARGVQAGQVTVNGFGSFGGHRRTLGRREQRLRPHDERRVSPGLQPGQTVIL